MAWKRCPGCTRAISESADVCDYCGAPYVEAPAGTGGRNDEVPADLFDVDRLLDQGSLFPESLPLGEMEPFNPADLPEEGAASGDLFADLEVPAAHHARRFAGEELAEKHHEPASPVEAGAEAVKESPLAAFAAAAAAHAPALPPAATSPAAPAVNRRRLAMAGVGLAGAAVLLVSFFSARGAASPDTAVTANAAPSPARPAAATPRRSVPVPPTSIVRPPQWNRVTDGRWIGRSPKSLAVELPAAEAVHVWMRDVKPLLVVRCAGGATDVFVYTQSAAQMEPQDGDHTVRVTLDEESEVTERWPDSVEHDALFARDGQSFVQQLMRARTMRFGFTPHNAGPVFARFDVNGLAELLAPAAAECGWKKTAAPKSVRARGGSGSAKRQ